MLTPLFLNLRRALATRQLSAFPAQERLSAYAESTLRFSLLAFGIPGFATDERLSSMQSNDGSSNEQHQAKRCEEPLISPVQYENTFVPARNPSRCNRIRK